MPNRGSASACRRQDGLWEGYVRYTVPGELQGGFPGTHIDWIDYDRIRLA